MSILRKLKGGNIARRSNFLFFFSSKNCMTSFLNWKNLESILLFDNQRTEQWSKRSPWSSVSSSNRDRNYLLFRALILILLIQCTTVSVTCLNSISLEQSTFWWMIQWHLKSFLLRNFSRRKTQPMFLPTIAGAPSVQILSSWSQLSLCWLMLEYLSACASKITAPVVVVFSWQRPSRSWTTSKFSLTHLL